jgi:LAS superfamily LD-carboxypeptidase LdcB
LGVCGCAVWLCRVAVPCGCAVWQCRVAVPLGPRVRGQSRRGASVERMHRLSRRTLVIIVAAIVTLALAVTAVVIFVLGPEADSRAKYGAAVEEVRAAHASLVAAQQSVVTSLDTAATTAGFAITFATTTGPGFVADAATIESVRTAADALIADAELSITDTVVSAPEVPAVEALGTFDDPGGRAERLAAADTLTARVSTLEESTARYTMQAEQLSGAIGSVDTAMDGVLASAYQTGTTDALPALASADTVAAYTAAVDALALPVVAGPSAAADRLARLVAYRDGWLAGVASHEVAARAQSAVSEPTFIRGILIANKTYALPSGFGDGLTAETSAAFAAMKAEAASQGHNLYIASGFRSFGTQTSIYNRYVSNDGVALADTYSARPGHSEHQTGLTFDLNTITQQFGSTPAGLWVAENAHRFGFIIRYPPGKEAITGYVWEPWHMRFLGTDVATKVHSSGLTLEEYLGITSAY